MSKIIDFAEVKRARDSARLKGALLAMPEGVRAVFMAATQHHLLDSDRERVYASTSLFEALEIAQAIEEI